MANGSFVAYYRVSTAKQGRSGLGLEAQQAAVAGYLNGGSWTLAGAFTEVESGKDDARPQLAAALRQCRMIGATLVIAKLDRLARKVRFISGLMEEGVPFVACDMPNATPFMLHIYAAVAEEEAKAISKRTVAALQAAKGRGVKLGGYRGGPPPVAALGGAARAAGADAHAAMVRPVLAELQARGMSLQAMARELERRGIVTPTGGRWTATAVSRSLAR